MKPALNPLSTDLERLQAQLRNQVAANEALVREKTRLRVERDVLREQLNLLLAKRYGPSSEKSAPGQTDLFFNEAEAEVGADEDAGRDSDEDAGDDTVTVPEHSRRKAGRRPLPEALPRIEVIHDLSEAEKICPADGHTLAPIGEEITEQLDIVPAKVQVIRRIRKKYACPCCQGTVKIAPLPPQPIPKSLATAGLLAHVVVAKYQDALPLYRQEGMFQRIGVDLPRATLANWMIKAGALVQPLINRLRDELLDFDCLQMDETPVQVLKEAGKAATSKSYMWVQRGGPPGRSVILFDYDPSRSQQVPLRLLDGFQGYLQSDAYEGYGAICAQPGVTAVGCWSHARRKFDEAVKAQGRGKPKAGKASKGLALIQKLYRIEKLAKDLEPAARQSMRQAQAKPLLDDMRAWLDQSLPQVPPQSATGKALHYLNNQWTKLIRYLDDGRLAIDNNACERAIRPFVTGRKNWIFSDTPRGAKASAALYSLIETAKANHLEPYRYLRRIFKELPAAQSLDDIDALLPWNIDDQNDT